MVRPERVRIRSVTGRSVLHLKSLTQSGDVRRTIADLELPAKVGASTSAVGDLRAMCTAPEDWLLVSSRYRLSGPLRERIGAEAKIQGIGVIDLSAGLSVFEVSGTDARAVLGKGCGLDLDSRAFAHPQCARARLAQVAVVIAAHDDKETFELYVARSHGPWLKEWLADSALESPVGR